ncbi:lysophospholipid acyltransferase family protein [Galenea microaerophila]
MQSFPILLIRSTLFSLGQVITLIFFSTIGFLLLPFSFKVRYQFMSKWAVFVVWWAKITCGIRYQVYGAENIDKSKPGIVLARHESAWETFATQLIFPRQAFVLKRELLNIPFFGWGMRLLHPIAIDRGAGRQALNQLLEEGQQRLQEGVWVIIFPEGTRMPVGELGKINIGGPMLAVKSQAPTYLMAHNAGQCWPKNSFIKRPGLIEVYISAPLDPSQMGVKEISQAAENWFLQHSVSKEQSAGGTK